MHISKILQQNPLRALGYEEEDVIPEGGMGCVLARSGTGKTAFLVQMAFHGMFRGKNVLHLSFENPVQKVCLWYEEMFHEIVTRYNVHDSSILWSEILPRRFIFSFSSDENAVDCLEKKITEMRTQNLFAPQTVVVDGFPFDASHHELLKKIKTIAVENGFHVWFSVRTHRHEQKDAGGIPPQMEGIDELFDVIVGLQSAESQVQLIPIKGSGPIERGRKERPLYLDPATMLIKTC